VFQQRKGLKWHQIWWPTSWEGPKRVFLTHVGVFSEKLDTRRPVSEVPPGDLCRKCFPAERGNP